MNKNHRRASMSKALPPVVQWLMKKKAGARALDGVTALCSIQYFVTVDWVKGRHPDCNKLTVAKFWNRNFFEECLPMLCSGCLELTTENCH